ncbi:MAG: RrF2 family transcriptional regulator [bacterium]
MLKLSKKSEYGIIALKHMLNQPAGEVSTAKDIARVYNIPAEVMAKILQTLARKGIVQSSQGAKGGYFLAREGGRISLSEIIESIEGPVGIVNCVNDQDCDCVQLTNCNISDPFKVIQKQFKIFLSGISLADINDQMEMQRVRWY